MLQPVSGWWGTLGECGMLLRLFGIAAQGHKGSARAWGQNRHYLFTPYKLAIDMLVESPKLPRLVRLLTPWLIVCGACLVQREIEACGSVARMPW